MEPPVDYRKYRIWFTTFLVVLLGGFCVGMWLYGEPFVFFEYPFSGLGATKTVNGFENHASMVVFVGTMIATGIIFIAVSIVLVRDRAIPFRGLRIVISLTAAFGAFISTFPHDLFDLQHKLGAGFFVGSVWLTAVFFLVDAVNVISRRLIVALHLVLHVTVLAYAIAFMVDSPTKQFFQKFAVMGLGLAIEMSIGALCHGPVESVRRSSPNGSQVPQ